MRASFHRAPKRFTVAPVVEASTKRMNLNRQPVTVACERAYELLDEEDSQGDAGAKATAATLRNAGLKYCWQLERIGTEDWRALGLNLGVKAALSAAIESLAHENRTRVTAEAAAAAPAHHDNNNGEGRKPTLTDGVSGKSKGMALSSIRESVVCEEDTISSKFTFFHLIMDQLIGRPWRFLRPFDHTELFRLGTATAAGAQQQQEHMEAFLDNWVVVAALFAGVDIGLLSLSKGGGMGEWPGYGWVNTLFDLCVLLSFLASVLASLVGVVLSYNSGCCGTINFDAFMLVTHNAWGFFDFLIILMCYTLVLAVSGVAFIYQQSVWVAWTICSSTCLLGSIMLYFLNMVSILNFYGGLFSGDERICKEVDLAFAPSDPVADEDEDEDEDDVGHHSFTSEKKYGDVISQLRSQVTVAVVRKAMESCPCSDMRVLREMGRAKQKDP